MIDMNTVLIANRGEIAVRVIRSARALGMRTVAVYSDADAGAPHVRAADVAFRLGPPPVGESYLSIERLLAACEATGAGLVHPGYGFLSERAAFARAVTEAGRVFVGPPAAAIDAMGDKARAKTAMRAADVPTVPGFDGEDPDDETLIAAAAGVGFPLLVKAAAGGGGRGMRVVRQASELPGALASARREAQGAFGSGALLLERLIERGRHVEVQVMADRHGTVLHLGERDCSVQRRHQKVIEEAPSPAVGPALRAEMGAAAVRAAAAVGYVGAGTVEFLLDSDGSFYFLEMNTRLQVEHPVTELVTGLDLVALQLRVALGEPLGLSQDDVRLSGHAIEARLYAEEPAEDYAPRTGTITAFEVPAGPGLRCDRGVGSGDRVSAFYDPMLAKLMAVGPDRATARRRLVRMLEQSVIDGVVTNRAFLGRVLEHPVFVAGEATTRFLDGTPELAREPDIPEDVRTLAVAAHLGLTTRPAFRNSHPVAQRVVLDVDGVERAVALGVGATVSVDGTRVQVEVDGDGRGTLVHGEQQVAVHLCRIGGTTRAQIRGHVVRVEPWDPSPVVEDSRAGDGVIRAASAGTVVVLPVTVGDRVDPDTVVAVVEAMKLETGLRAGVSGVVAEVRGQPGAPVAAGDTLVLITPDPVEGGAPSEEAP